MTLDPVLTKVLHTRLYVNFRKVPGPFSLTALRVPITVVIPTLNEADRLPACLASVSWAAEIIIADAGSTDATLTIAREFGARVIEQRGPTIARQRNVAIAAATQPWVLAVDADERATPELRDAIAATVASPTVDAYRVHMRNRYLGAPMERGGWGQDRHVRLFRSSLRWREQRVHESLDYEGPVVDLAGRLEHDSYRDLAHQLSKVQTYSIWGAADLNARGKTVGFSHLVIRPLWRFVKCYFLQGAWLEGKRGIVLAGVHAWSAFAKYALLWDLQRKQGAAEGVQTGAGRLDSATVASAPLPAEPTLAPPPPRSREGVFEPTSAERVPKGESVVTRG